MYIKRRERRAQERGRHAPQLAFVGVDGVGTRKRNDVVRRFEASDATVLLAWTGTLNRGVTVNGANHVLILNLEWSPETTLQAEFRREGVTVEEAVEKTASQLVFGRVPAQTKSRQRRAKPRVKAIYFRNLLENDEYGNEQTMALPPDQPI